jgi:hypothetical protein
MSQVHAVSQSSSQGDLIAQLAALRAENEALKAAGNGKLTVKSNGKTVSVYGLGRFPVSLYAQGWERLLAAAPQITACIKANPDLPRK